MTYFTAVRRTALTLAVLGVFALAAPCAAAGEEPFAVNGTFRVLAIHGNDYLVALEGEASPGGSFTALYVARRTGVHIEGTVTLQFNGNSSLTVVYQADYNHTSDLFEGEFVIVGGTGQFRNAMGGGEICYPIDAPDNPFMMIGTLIR